MSSLMVPRVDFREFALVAARSDLKMAWNSV
jgi:hypothetical protein